MITLWYFNIAIENTTFIVDSPIQNGDFPKSYVSLLEGINYD